MVASLDERIRELRHQREIRRVGHGGVWSGLERAADIVFGFAVRDVALEQPILAENRFELGAPVIEAKWLRSLFVVQKVGRHRGNVYVELRGGGRGDASKPRGPRERNDSRCRTVMRREMIE